MCTYAYRLAFVGVLIYTFLRTPSIAKYGMLADYGMADNVEDDPLAQMNQAECLLALYMLHKEKAGAAAVDFLDADRLEVLQG